MITFKDVEALDAWEPGHTVRAEAELLVRRLNNVLGTINEAIQREDAELLTIALLDLGSGAVAAGKCLSGAVGVIGPDSAESASAWLKDWIDKCEIYKQNARLLDELSDSIAELDQ